MAKLVFLASDKVQTRNRHGSCFHRLYSYVTRNIVKRQSCTRLSYSPAISAVAPRLATKAGTPTRTKATTMYGISRQYLVLCIGCDKSNAHKKDFPLSSPSLLVNRRFVCFDCKNIRPGPGQVPTLCTIVQEANTSMP